MIAMDLDYIAQRSLGMDVRLLLSTIPAVLTRRGAR
jgi:lipopolysaccharide/colanic/teichoic acid biosynthesis glycosyltransferase